MSAAGSGAVVLVGLALGLLVPANAQEAVAQPTHPTPAALWERLSEALPDVSYEVESDEVVVSDTDPQQQLRRIKLRFRSQTVGQWRRRMVHPAVVHLPVDPARYASPERRGRVVVIAQRYGDDSVIANYGEPIAAATGYPTMVLPVPGEYDGHDGEDCWMDFFQVRISQTQDPLDHDYFRLAVPYLRALDVFSSILGVEPAKIRAVIGGHSKRATSAFTAAAVDPRRVVGVVYMGNESTWERYGEDSPFHAISPAFTQRWVEAKVLYLGATNEDGYRMFNINRIQEMMKRPWTIEYIPNYRHASNSEIQFMNWRMWVSHVFDGRPTTRISELAHERTPEGTRFRARIESENKIIQAKAWYVYSDNEYWRDLTWYPVAMRLRGEAWEGFLEGKLPDAWLVEVKDTARGMPGYLSSLPQDITGKPTRTRFSQGSVPRQWEPAR